MPGISPLLAPSGRRRNAQQFTGFLIYVLDLFFLMVFDKLILLNRGRQPVALVGGAGCGACGFGLRNRTSGGPRRHRPAQLCGSVRQRADEADESGGNPVESRAVENGAPVRLQKAIPGLKENAAVERREARRSASWIGNPVR